jgi:methylphosphotriester-DNA--protein-cysteine methyltransferase
MEPNIIKRERVRFGAPALTEAGPRAAPRCKPQGRKAELVTVAGAVRAIEVTCSCGEMTLVEIELAGAAHAEAGKEKR